MTTFETIYRFFGWWVINIDLFLLLLMILGGTLLFFKKNRWGRRFLFISCTCLIFVGMVPFSLWIFENLENRFPKVTQIPADAKGIILLGGSVDKMTSLGTSFETEAAKRDFLALGLDPVRVQFEQDSKDTKENAARTAILLNPLPHEKWVLVTSAYHMPRSVGLFRKAGFNVIPYPMDYHAPGHYEMWFFLGLALSLEAWQASSREWSLII